jgi:hypothetical protein
MQRGEEKIVVSLNDAKERESVAAAPAGTGTATAKQTPGQPAQAVQQKRPSLTPGQQASQESPTGAATARDNVEYKGTKKRPNKSPITPVRLPQKKKNKESGGGWFGDSFSN